MQDQEKNDQTEQIRKRPYTTPQLVVYGNIAEVTRSTSPTGMGDGAQAGNAKTA